MPPRAPVEGSTASSNSRAALHLAERRGAALESCQGCLPDLGGEGGGGESRSGGTACLPMAGDCNTSGMGRGERDQACTSIYSKKASLHTFFLKNLVFRTDIKYRFWDIVISLSVVIAY